MQSLNKFEQTGKRRIARVLQETLLFFLIYLLIERKTFVFRRRGATVSLLDEGVLIDSTKIQTGDLHPEMLLC